MAKKRTDGRIKRTFTYNGKRYYVYGRTKAEAKERELEKLEKIKEKTYQKGKGLTVDGYHERWVKAREGVVRPATIRKQNFEYNAMSKTAIDEAGTTFGSLKLVEVERQNIKDLQAALKAAKRKDGETPKYSTRSINDMISLLNHIFNDALIERIITWNPVKGVKPLKRTEPQARDTIHRALTVEETKAFFEAAASSWYCPLYRFMINSGCRVGEAGAVRTADIKDNELRIERTVTKDVNGAHYVGDTAKTDSGVRSIPYTQSIKSAVEAQKEANAAVFGNVIEMEGRIFKSSEGSLLNETVVNRDIKRICKSAGIDRFTSHAFRDTFATRAIESGMNPRTLQEILGHSDIGMTMNLYAHVMDETKEKEMKKIVINI